MVHFLRLALAAMSTTSCVVADVASCQQTDETTLLQGIVRHPEAQSQPLPDVGPQALVPDAALQPLVPGAVPDIDEMREWVANHPVVAKQIREAASDELVDALHHPDMVAARFPGVATAIEEWVVGGAATGTPQQRVRKLIKYIRGVDSAAHRNLLVERQHRKGSFNLLEKATSGKDPMWQSQESKDHWAEQALCECDFDGNCGRHLISVNPSRWVAQTCEDCMCVPAV